jgi:AraC family transcriptional regulator
MATYRIENLPAKMIAGFPCFGKPGTNGLFGRMWDLFNNQLLNHTWHQGKPGIGIELYLDNCSTATEWFYLAGAFLDYLEEAPANVVIKPIPQSDYFVVTHKGPVKTLDKTYHTAYRELLPQSAWKPWLPFDFELYDQRFMGPNDVDSSMEIWIPVKSK